MRRFMYRTLAAAWVVLAPSVALAANSSGAGTDIDPRFQNYPVTVWADGSVAMAWLLGIFLMILCVAGVFKSAKRTHLD